VINTDEGGSSQTEAILFLLRTENEGGSGKTASREEGCGGKLLP